MDGVSTTFSYTDSDRKNLEILLETFGATMSLDDIALAYCQADRDLYAASEILCNLTKSSSTTSTLTSEVESVSGISTSSECSLNTSFNKSETSLRSKRYSASMGTVSSVIGKHYMQHTSSSNIGSSRTSKPVRLDSTDIPISEIWDEKPPQDIKSRTDIIDHEVEEFLFKMLGDGFNLQMSVIQDVVGQCGYDVKKSMERLLDLSSPNFKKSDDILSVSSAPETEEMCLKLESLQFEEKPPLAMNSSGRLRLPKMDNRKYQLQNDVLQALFNVPERTEENQVRIRRIKEPKKSRVVVEEPLEETSLEYLSITARPLGNEKNNSNYNCDEEERGESFEMLRKAVKEYWFTMKEYYSAAVDAFLEKDNERAFKLLQEGDFFKKKAREADEKSAQKIIGNRDQEEVCFNLHFLEPKEAVKILKLHLTSFSGIASIQSLNIRLGVTVEDPKEGPRKRRIKKLLEKESIRWTEEEDGKVMVIHVGEINPKNLSFYAKK